MVGDTTTHQPEIHHAHRDVTGGWLRPTTFGIMDGLVSSFALVAGMVAGDASRQAIVLAGLAGLAAGAGSMASGEFVSVSSQTELMRAEIAIERRELERNADEELAELVAIFEAKGLSSGLAREVAHELSENPEVAWRVHVREELGLDPDDLPSPWLAAGSSFLAFALGAFVPLIPFLAGLSSLLPSLVLSAAGLGIAGAVIARLTARTLWFGAGRQLLFGGMSAAITYGIGLIVGSLV